MGLKDFVSGVGDAVENVGKGANYLANPRHWDDVAKGVGKVGEFVVENPGQTLDIAGQVGKAVLKDQMDPMNLAINAGLLAATVATGGAAAPAFLAKMGLGAKSVSAGISAAKGADTAIDVAKGVKTTAKAIDAASDVAKAGKLAKVDKVLGVNKLDRVFSPIETRAGAGAFRAKQAQNILERGGEAPGLARQATAALVQGTGRRAPTQLVGMSDKVHDAQMVAWRGQRVKALTVGSASKASAANAGVEAAANPVGYAMAHGGEEKVNDYINERAGSGTGYTDLGQTGASLYGNEDQTGTRTTAFGQGASSVASPQASSPYGMKGAGNQQPPSGPPPTGTPTPSTPSAPSASMGTSSSSSAPPRRTGDWMPSGPHFWEGPRSQWAGGIGANYDWRPIDPLRKIDSSTPKQAQRRNAYLNKKDAWKIAQDAPNEQGAPSNFSPEVDKEGMYAISQGQQPLGALNPGQPRMGEGPVVRSGEARGSRHYATPRPEPVGALGAGSATSRTSSIIDVDSSSPADFGVDQKGQGFFDLHSMGSSLADVGAQPNTTKPTKSVGSGPTVYNTSTRGARRREGKSTTGMNPAKTFF